jgi:hypothetical protein
VLAFPTAEFAFAIHTGVMAARSTRFCCTRWPARAVPVFPGTGSGFGEAPVARMHQP